MKTRLPAHYTLVACLVLPLTTASSDEERPDAPAPPNGRIRPYAVNPRYWQYLGKPVLLLGGSRTDHIFLAEELDAHLDEMVRAGGNYVRNTMSQREGPDLKPHLRLESGRFDLDRWNPEYWKRFAGCLEACRKRDIIVQIEVWDRFDFSQEHWAGSPWNPDNNVNYDRRATGLASEYRAPAWRDRQPFFHTIPGMRLYRKELDLVRSHQERFVEKMLACSLSYPNVLYCMNNETSTPPAWGKYWMGFIRGKAAGRGVDVFVTDMFDDVWKPEESAKLAQAFERPDLYPFLDISQVNSRNFDQDHWDRLWWIRGRTGSVPRPLNHTKIYSDGETSWGSGTPRDGVERFWRNLIAGSASCRFHRPGAGIGLNDTAKACLRAARAAESVARFWELEPRMDLLRDRETDEAYLAAKPGEAYLLYFTDGGSVGLDLTGAAGAFDLQWIELATGSRGGTKEVGGGTVVTVTAPRDGGWVAAIRRRS